MSSEIVFIRQKLFTKLKRSQKRPSRSLQQERAQKPKTTYQIKTVSKKAFSQLTTRTSSKVVFI